MEHRQVDFSRSKSSDSGTDDDSADEHSMSIGDLLQTAADDDDEAQSSAVEGDEGWPEEFRMEFENAVSSQHGNLETEEQGPTTAARGWEAAAGAREQEVTAGAREREVTVVARETTAAHDREAAVAREAAIAQEREATAAREREAADAARSRESAAAAARETTAAHDREAAAAREDAAVLEREAAPAREHEAGIRCSDSSVSRKRTLGTTNDSDSDLSSIDDRPLPQLIKTTQANRGTGRQPPPKRKKKKRCVLSCCMAHIMTPFFRN